MRKSFLPILCFLCGAVGLSGQVRVQVTDPSGKNVPGASVKISAGARTRSAQTDIQGQSIFRGLDPGVYTVEVTAKGFTPFRLSEFSVGSGPIQTVAVRLVIAAASERVTVNDNVSIDTEPSNNPGALVLRGP